MALLNRRLCLQCALATGWENALINMSYWDPMSGHFIKPSPPPGISSWTKLRLC
ncbi:MAG: hypothetical protein U9R55_04615 [Pseudomonadota bacterium]|jgi:hypothetical protein|nr:hypothetical protein [Pseudomonadota bacterium]